MKMIWWKLVLGTIAVGIVILFWNIYPLWKVTKLEEEAADYMVNGKMVEAEIVLRQALKLAETHWDESNTAPVLISLAIAILFQERWEEAEGYANRALGIFKKACGPTNTSVVNSLMVLANISAGKGRHGKANSYVRQAHSILQGEETHPELSNPAIREALREQVEEWFYRKR
ncbi:tetratricopeptide repeat protein [Amphritea sp. HPY]|uniref:tetratricopeptide repeat protein n=1 Tax=Amphritea sp. HPY TaxID=3421652 RepID=UPI003D7EA9F8